jgi:V8-like Glu-specific endopeptidase
VTPNEIVRKGRRFVRYDGAPGQARRAAGDPTTDAERIEGERPLARFRTDPTATYLGDADLSAASFLGEAPRSSKRDGSSIASEVPNGSSSKPAPMSLSTADCTGRLGRDTRVGVGGASRRMAAPYAQQIFYEPAGCTGVMIGPTTMLTAAHCVWENGDWLAEPTVFTPAFSAVEDDPKPFGEFTCWSFMAIPSTSGSEFWDYAVITFETCGDNQPAAGVGWLGWWVNPPLRRNDVQLSGYPVSFELQRGYPELVIGGGTAFATDAGFNKSVYYDSVNLDGSHGQSGAPWFVWDDGWYAIGVFNRMYCNVVLGSDNNRARRIDSAVERFINSNSTDW